MSTLDPRHGSAAPERGGAPAFEQGAGFLLSRLGAMAEREWGAAVRATGLRPTDHAVLAVVEEADARGETVTQRQVAVRVGVDPRNVVATVARLRSRGLLASAPSADDGRARILHPTPLGRAALAELGRALDTGRAGFFGALDASEYATLCALLGRVYADRVNDARG